MKSIVFYYSKKYSTGNEEWIESQKGTIILQVYVLHNHDHFISSLADKTNAPRKNEQYFYFSSPLEDTDIFPKLLF